MRRWLVILSGFVCFLSGCLYNARERADEAVCSLVLQPYDQQAVSSTEGKPKAPEALSSEKKSETPSYQPLDVQTTSLTTVGDSAIQSPADAAGPINDDQKPADKKKSRLEPPIPPEVPGSETPRLPGKASPEYLQQIYPKLPPLPEEPLPQPGLDGKPYTLSALQQIAAANSPTLRQAAFDVEAARGNWLQARAYPNPNVGWNVQPSNDGSTAGVQGPFVDQKIIVGGKLKKSAAAAEMDLRNAELALRRARSDLATQVRNAYFVVLVAKETVRVNKALAQFTDQIFVLQAAGLLPGAVSAPYEPAALEAQAFSVRLAYKQSVQAYIYAWMQLVAALGLRQLPLSEVAGRVDAFIPYYDYDMVLAHVLRNHTDVLTARNGIDKARYLLSLAQVTPVPDVDFNVSVLKEYSLLPKQFVHTATITLPFPIWDRNRGGIMAAESALGRALEEPHRVEENLTTMLATAYKGYKQNLDALEYYRKYILPNQVRYYRGVFDRRQIDPAAQFGDLVTAQQTLATDVSNYLSILGSLWTSVVSVADLLQTDDLFQLGQQRAVPALPNLEPLPHWPCCHDCPPQGGQPSGPCMLAPVSAAKTAAGVLPISQVSRPGEPGCVSAGRTRGANATPLADPRSIPMMNRTLSTSHDSFAMTRPEQNTKGVKAAEDKPLEDSGHSAPVQNQVSQRLPRRLPSLPIRQTPDSNDPLLSDEPPPVPYMLHKQSAENWNSN
jgi:cobalt-zinc-cadmium efflux system outer membrane protein